MDGVGWMDWVEMEPRPSIAVWNSEVFSPRKAV